MVSSKNVKKVFKTINIRGTNGAGKSTIITRLMKSYPTESIRTDPTADDLLDLGGRIEAYKVNYKGKKIYIIGSYAGRSAYANGGCDVIKSQDEVCNLVRKYAQRGHVIFEGVIVSTLYGRYLNLSKELGGMIWVFLDTPLSKCVKRITKRRGLRYEKFSGNENETLDEAKARWSRGEFRNMTLFESKYLANSRCRAKALKAGETVIDLNHRCALNDLYKILDKL